jgi:hypothetical protein
MKYIYIFHFRYLAIVYPFEQLMCFERHTGPVIAFIWIIGIINTLFQFNRLYGRDCDTFIG